MTLIEREERTYYVETHWVTKGWGPIDWGGEDGVFLSPEEAVAYATKVYDEYGVQPLRIRVEVLTTVEGWQP